MAVKTFEDAEFGMVRITKRRGARNLRLSITSKGEIRISIPAWSPYAAGMTYLRTQSAWLRQNLPAPSAQLQHGQQIGKAHRLYFDTASVDKTSSRLAGTQIRIVRPTGMAPTHASVQQTAEKACIRALRVQAARLLPTRLDELAGKYGFQYSSVQIKQLKGRWGSCDSRGHIVFNLFLMQLPWQLIDYVILHELVHTRHMNHGSDFWDEFLKHEPAAKQLRATIRQHKPVLAAVDPPPSVA